MAPAEASAPLKRLGINVNIHLTIVLQHTVLIALLSLTIVNV